MKKLILFSIPIIIIAEMLFLTLIAELIRQPSNMAVLAGFLLACVNLTANFYLIKFIQKTFKKTNKK